MVVRGECGEQGVNLKKEMTLEFCEMLLNVPSHFFFIFYLGCYPPQTSHRFKY